MAELRVSVWVRPRAPRPGVGGSREGDLCVAVADPPADGRANEAVRRALAEAFGLAPGAVRLVAGPRSRRKVFALDGDPGALGARLDALRAGGP